MVKKIVGKLVSSEVPVPDWLNDIAANAGGGSDNEGGATNGVAGGDDDDEWG